MKRLLFRDFQKIAEQNNFIFDKCKKTYELCTNHKHLGMGCTAVYNSLSEAYWDIKDIEQGISPLNHEKFR